MYVTATSEAYSEFLAAYCGYNRELDGGIISQGEYQWLIDKLRTQWIADHGTVPPR